MALASWSFLTIPLVLAGCGLYGYDSVPRDAGTQVDPTDDAALRPDADIGRDAGACGIALDTRATCAYREGGGAQCVGLGVYGELGYGGLESAATPVPVLGLSAIENFTGGTWGFCAVQGGVPLCWGRDGVNDDKFGEPLPEVVTEPIVAMTLDEDVRVMHLGARYSCALTVSGKVWCRGSNAFGTLGNNALPSGPTPVEVAIADVTALAAGYNGVCALLADQSVKCWGLVTPNGSDGPTDMGLSNIVKVEGFGGAFFAIDTSAKLWAWGQNNSAQLGIGTMVTRVEVPVTVDLDNVIDVATGEKHGCALLADGSVYCWGRNPQFQLGIEGLTQELSPVKVPGIPADGIRLESGQDHTCVLSADGTITCWGDSCCFELGDGTNTSTFTGPVTSSLDCSTL